MAIVEELLELEDKSTGIVDSGPSPRVFTPTVDSVPKSKKNWLSSLFYSKWLRTFATVWLPILGGCYLITSLVVNHALKDIDSHIDQTIDKRLSLVNQSLTGIDNRLHDLEGWRKGLEDRNLANIRMRVGDATKEKQVLPPAQVAEYRRTILAQPSTGAEFWETVASLINYQSFVNQMKGLAPDPTKVAKTCMTTADQGHGGRSFENKYGGMVFSDCIVDLDTNTFRDVVFKDSVIKYRGGAVSLKNVLFVNCRFVLDLAVQPVKDSQKNLILAILKSPDQKSVQIPN